MSLSPEKSQELKRKADEIASILGKKNFELEKYAVLYESIAPVPKKEPARVLKLLDSENNEGVKDYRDIKIVDLAKKCRNLRLALTNEKTIAESNSREKEELVRRFQIYTQEIELLSSSPNNSSTMTSHLPQIKGSPEKISLRQELLDKQKSIKDMRRKLKRQQEENKVSYWAVLYILHCLVM